MDLPLIDMHLHVLPDVDDGASSPQMSRSMLAMCARFGFTRLVATPHLMEPLTHEYHSLVTSAIDTLRPVAAEAGIALDGGYEHLLSPGLADRLQAGEPSTLAGSKAVLVELPFVGWPQHTESSLFSLRTAGFRPVLAHPERYVAVQENPELAIAAGERGIVLQLTFGSYVGVYGKSAARSARQLLELALERDVAIVFATDAHSDGQRLSQVPAGMQWISRKVPDGARVIEWGTSAVPSLFLRNEPVPGFHAWRQANPGIPANELPGDQALPELRPNSIRRFVNWVSRSSTS